MLNRAITVTRAGLLAAALSVGGCAKDRAGGDGAGGRSRGPDSQFETSRDPPIASDTRYAAGQLAEGRGALASAAEQYRHVLRRDPRHLPAMYRLGVVYAGMRRYGDAIEVWKRYVAATNDSAAGYSNLGFCYELAHRPDDAETAYRKGIERDPRHVACRVNYGLMLVRRGREGEGRTQFRSVLTPAEVHYNVGSVYQSLGRPEQAKIEYGRALALDPALTDARARLDELGGTPRGAGATPAAPAGSADAGAPPGE